MSSMCRGVSMWASTIRTPAGWPGLLAGRFLGAAASSKVALLSGSLAYRGHQEREMGFRQILNEEFPNLQLVEVRENQRKIVPLRDRPSVRSWPGTPTLPRSTTSVAARSAYARLSKKPGGRKNVFLFAHDLSGGQAGLPAEWHGRRDFRPGSDTNRCAKPWRPWCRRVRRFRYTFIQPSLRVIFRENLPAA